MQKAQLIGRPQVFRVEVRGFEFAIIQALTFVEGHSRNPGMATHSRALYRVTRMVAERIMLTSNSKFRHRPGWQTNLTVKRNFKFGVNINYSATIRVTL